ncbi:hypothetical protein N7466_011571 [Penicillium verhagenii]|uniref:uncharacterized protein n=1 Tax=Penicillium verhagenii TaxID=1562060 RepID=UPI002544DBF0|nr:uncharacterized protein N7466_011571 [Penicillium verhagenii]KAJ5915638.1 hypothetical protein N7466_011571 [Penicillium verhagenii]
MSSPSEYTVGWICALLVEYVAAQEFLDEEHEKPSSVSPNDTNDYTLGKMGEHNVVIAVLPDGEYGTASAANVATNMMNTFRNVRIGLMVGIGGGVPSPRHDIRLGDVVVSAPRNGEGGVFQYDFGKSIQGESFQHTRFLNQPPTLLRTAIMGTKASYERKGHRLVEAINSLLDANPRLRKYKKPISSTDRLFIAEALHDLRGCSAYCASDPSRLILRREREEHEDNPAIHYGLIASANQLMKDALARDKLAAEKDVLCFEMEAAGLLNTFPCLVIRGICDYSDSHKHKEWQGWAAMVAAAYAKDLLKRIPLNKVEAEERISAVLHEVLESTTQRLYDQQEKHHKEDIKKAFTDKQQACHQSFKKGSYTDQKNINPEPAEGTCRWALQSPEYVRWWESCGNELLWISADPGCGKSVLARSIVDNCSRVPDPTVAVCYFFFKDNGEQNTLATALCAILHQLFSQKPHLLDHALPAWEKNGNDLQKEVEELWKIFLEATSANTSCKTICVFDALDECYENDQGRLISKLEQFHHQSLSNASTQDSLLKFLVTSRPYDHIQSQFDKVTQSFPQIHLKGEEENEQIREEIDLVVKIRVKELAHSAMLSPKTAQQLEHKLLEMEHRTYLWLYLAMDDIRTAFQNSLRPAEESIQMIPDSVNAAYQRILSRVPSEQVDTVKKMLQIIVAARRPLSIEEMGMALGIALYPQSKSQAEAGLDTTNLGAKLRRLCGLFVFLNADRNIHLIHQTAKEFLIRGDAANQTMCQYSCTFTEAEDHMAHICLRYLSMDFPKGKYFFKNNYSFEEDCPFVTYSTTYWADHVRCMTPSTDREVSDLLHQVYNTTSESFGSWFPIFRRKHRNHPMKMRMNEMKAIHLAAFNGHEQVVCDLLAKDTRVSNLPDGFGIHPLAWATLKDYGNIDILRILLRGGADINAQSESAGSALQAACVSRFRKAVEMLLENGADVNTQGGHYGSALQAACAREGSIELAEILLEHGADVNTQGGHYGSALQAACADGSIELVEILLKHGADVNIQGGYLGSALQAACADGSIELVEILLKHGADVNIQGGYLGSALQDACLEGSIELVEILLEHGADVHTQGGYYGSALQVACVVDSTKLVRILLEHGADVHTQGGYHGFALQAACAEGSIELVEILLEHGADINTQGGHYGSALQAACAEGSIEHVEILLDHGADTAVLHEFDRKVALQAANALEATAK